MLFSGSAICAVKLGLKLAMGISGHPTSLGEEGVTPIEPVLPPETRVKMLVVKEKSRAVKMIRSK